MFSRQTKVTNVLKSPPNPVYATSSDLQYKGPLISSKELWYRTLCFENQILYSLLSLETRLLELGWDSRNRIKAESWLIRLVSWSLIVTRGDMNKKWCRARVASLRGNFAPSLAFKLARIKLSFIWGRSLILGLFS